MKTSIPWRERAGLRIEEAAGILGLGRSFVWELVREGTLESFKIGRVRRVTPESVEALIVNGMVSAKQQEAA